jgi:hypothetical protein
MSENQDAHCTGHAHINLVVVNNNSIQPESHAPVSNPAPKKKTQIQHKYTETEQNIVDDDNDDESTAFETTKFMIQVL